VWISLVAALNITTVVLSTSGYRTVEWVNWTIPALVVLCMYALGQLMRSKAGGIFCALGTAGYALLWAWHQTLPRPEYAYILGPAAWALLSLGAAGLIVIRLRSRELRSFRDFGMLTGMGVLVTYAPLATLEAVSVGLAQTNPDLVMLLWTIRIGLMILGSLLFTLAFLWTLPPRSVSGYSASAL
jgi:hypothetical protein